MVIFRGFGNKSTHSLSIFKIKCIRVCCIQDNEGSKYKNLNVFAIQDHFLFEKWPFIALLCNKSNHRFLILKNERIPINGYLLGILIMDQYKELGILPIQVNFWAIFNEKWPFFLFLAINQLLVSYFLRNKRILKLQHLKI